MSGHLVGLALIWVGAALSLILGLRAVLTSEVGARLQVAVLGVFGASLLASFFIGPAPGQSLTAPLSVAFFSVTLLVFIILVESARARGCR